MTEEALREIDTIIVVMMENRSFDHVLGFLSHESFDGRTDIDGLHQHSAAFDWDNPDGAGNPYGPTATPDGYLPCDMPHSRAEVAAQLASGSMLGFMQSYRQSQQIDASPAPMRFCRPQDIPVTAALARNYTVCDRWFASLPDDTMPNRLMALSGYSQIDSTAGIKPPFHLLPDQTTIFDWLASKGRRFSIYVDAQPITDVGPPSNLLLMKSQWQHVAHHTYTLDMLERHWNSAAPAPEVIYCEPFYNDFAIAIGLHGNCNHPPLPMAYGEAFLHRVYTTLTANPQKWARSMLVICYDEHGGFFDHVPPPEMIYRPPANAAWVDPTPFTTLGVRIPGIVVSPLVDRGAFHGLLDHTSILQVMVDRFGEPGDLAGFGDAAARKASGVGSLASALTRSVPRLDTPLIPAPPTAALGAATTPAISKLAAMFRAIIADKPGKAVA
ncbi:MAG TPA: alkaline phosphatase family protein [Kofleriaceae bacterium]|nr:alkaline phosphatase family protein [Kofleriaceae bacterium]